MTSVRFALDAPIEGEYSDPALQAELAVEAEAAGWDAYFVMDHLIRRQPWNPILDPWVAMAAIAVATETILIGPMVTPLARRRTAVLARQTVTLDRLSGGRLILGVGLGAPDDEFTRFGESADPRLRAAILDESLELLQLLWTGEEVTYEGEHVMAEGVKFMPRPVNGIIPIWVAGAWPGGAPFRRAARHQGVWPISKGGGLLSVEAFGEMVKAVNQHGASDGFDFCLTGVSSGPDDEAALDRVGRAAEAGMNWWIEPMSGRDLTLEQVRERLRAGPPRI